MPKSGNSENYLIMLSRFSYFFNFIVLTSQKFFWWNSKFVLLFAMRSIQDESINILVPTLTCRRKWHCNNVNFIPWFRCCVSAKLEKFFFCLFPENNEITSINILAFYVAKFFRQNCCDLLWLTDAFWCNCKCYASWITYATLHFTCLMHDWESRTKKLVMHFTCTSVSWKNYTQLTSIRHTIQSYLDLFSFIN